MTDELEHAHDDGYDDGHEDGYDGAVTVHLEDRDVTVTATLRGHFEPLDGHYHWYGRLAADDTLGEIVGSGRAAARVTTEHATAECQLGDVDPWGRLRISGTSTPPFPIARTLEDVEGAG